MQMLNFFFGILIFGTKHGDSIVADSTTASHNGRKKNQPSSLQDDHKATTGAVTKLCGL